MTTWQEHGQAVLEAYTATLVDHGTPPQDRDALAEAFVGSLAEPSLFSTLCGLTDLTVDEAQALAVLAAVEVSPALQRLVAVVHDDDAQPRVTLSLLDRLFPHPGPGALVVAEDGRLRRAALVDVETHGPWAGRAVSAAGPLVWALRGDTSLDPGLPPGAEVLRTTSPGPPRTGVLHLLSGADRQSRRLCAGGELGGAGLLVTPPPATRDEYDAVVREATLGGLAVLVEVDDGVPPGLERALRRAEHLSWGLASPQELPLADLPDLPRRDLAVLDGTASEQDWLDEVGAPAPAGVRLDRRQLQLVALSQAPVPEAVRRLAGGHLERLATRVRPTRTWEDLVLPPPLAEQVRGLVMRHRQRRTVYDVWGFPGLPSRGTVALLAGPSGTGKTLTAEVLAGELGLDLFVLDLSSLMSKYIGETEKNLGALFDAAAAGDVVLFFDEADALFGKRSPVSDAKDRYANVEVAYLLQRLERHDGLVLLATNLPNNIDDAFLRRLHATLEYAPPGPQERRAIWAAAFPPGCPTQDLDLDLVAETVELSGGPVATAALSAAFAAASREDPVTMADLQIAVAAEYRKQGRLAVPDLLRR